VGCRLQSRLSKFKGFEEVVEDYENTVREYRMLLARTKRDYIDRTIQLTLVDFLGCNYAN